MGVHDEVGTDALIIEGHVLLQTISRKGGNMVIGGEESGKASTHYHHHLMPSPGVQ